MSTDDLTEALRIAGQARGFTDPSSRERALVVLADEVDRLRAERDEWAMQWRGADDMFGAMRDERDELLAERDTARAALERVRVVVEDGDRLDGLWIYTPDIARALEGTS